MALPSGGPWPPPPHGTALAQQAIWSAWLVGDPEGLRTAYSDARAAGGALQAHTQERSFEPLTSRQGGIIPTIARLFWGRASTSGGRKAGLHVPLAADIATASADLLFSEPPQFVVDEKIGSEKAKARVDALLNTGEFHASLVESAEVVAGLGGGWLRLVWDIAVADHVMVDTVPADSAIGEWRWGQLQAVTFFTEYTKGSGNQEVLRHLERHEPGAIFHGLYRGDAKTLGTPAHLAEHPSTLPYADLVDDEGAITTGITSLTAAYVANMRPQRRWRKIEPLVELGRSDFDGVEPLMDALDETYTSWMRDVRLAKARIIVPEFMLKDLGKGKGTAWDEDQEVFTQLNVAPMDAKNAEIKPQQFAIRVAEHRATADDLVDHTLRAAGYSPSTFGEGGEGQPATATEVVSRERQSSRTRDKKTRYWSQALKPLLTTWLELDASIFTTGATGEVTVKWADEAQADPLTLAQTADTLRRAQAASTATLVAMMHPDWDEAKIAAEVDLVRVEAGTAVPDIGPPAGA